MLVAPAHAGDWSTADTARQAVFSFLAVGDWAQTRTIVKNNYTETNSVLGAHPSMGRVNNYFGLVLVGDALIARALPPGFRDAFQYVSVGIEVDAVRHNMKVGIGFTF